MLVFYTAVCINGYAQKPATSVEDIHLPSGDGEYPTQNGFGWSNGVYLKFYEMFRK